MEIIFWIGIGLITYTYFGYPVVLYILIKLKRVFNTQSNNYFATAEMPEVSLIIACYNEGEIIKEKIENTLQLHYPKEKLKIYFVTDGTSDGSEKIVNDYKEVTLFHSKERKGKNAAINRVLPFLNSPILVFCDANTFLNAEAILNIARHYKSDGIGAVAGEKRVMTSDIEDMAGSGEGAYWKYESALKKWDSELHTVVGAAGELFSVRRELMPVVPEGILIEDFYVSMKIAQNGYKVVYEPDAYAMETGSDSIAEERKRKIRIAAGGIQSIIIFLPLLNIFRYGWLCFQYVSHRMLRWSLAPLSLLVVFSLNIYLVIVLGGIYTILMGLQLLFYLIAAIGAYAEGKIRVPKIVLLPFYFAFMNLSVFQGFIRLLKGKQSAVWEKSKRKNAVS
ncbi:Glycosyltransferase, catalytic subunit of cellulose synthase and poly-beta-1,6-N-acetylglucosamine synthase [Marivirga sericea]|uniref:Glycosyltransferase, catalytic subunit of cellulose synthase and poly-beta-1,6-N-acetylglucosamine synthase n=1 Tax=Marivirga sericea TaxID=1028 RepID=A0A1X7LAS9_9BACT|nr:glycosyltransferase family 2 protein [Marivirga sericea]SMG50941.1 Glycosyltransferase, catalytic subunit of cellulose synthase and poly-beta-1,6-N-acetylglucosamine synthase [Marivirga sericea]